MFIKNLRKIKTRMVGIEKRFSYDRSLENFLIIISAKKNAERDSFTYLYGELQVNYNEGTRINDSRCEKIAILFNTDSNYQKKIRYTVKDIEKYLQKNYWCISTRNASRIESCIDYKTKSNSVLDLEIIPNFILWIK